MTNGEIADRLRQMHALWGRICHSGDNTPEWELRDAIEALLADLGPTDEEPPLRHPAPEGHETCSWCGGTGQSPAGCHVCNGKGYHS